MWADGGFAEAITTSKEPHLSTQLAEWQFSKKINKLQATLVETLLHQPILAKIGRAITKTVTSHSIFPIVR